MRTSAAVVLFVGLALATDPVRAEEPRKPTLREVSKQLERAQMSTPELTQRYRATKTVDGKPEQDLTFEIHRSAGVSAMVIESGGGTAESAVFLADPYGLRCVKGGRVEYAMPGPVEIASVVRPLDLVCARLLRRWSVQPGSSRRRDWLYSLGLKRSPEGEVRLNVSIATADLSGADLLQDLSPGGPTTITRLETGLVRFSQDDVTVEIRSRDGLLRRWEVRQPETRTSRVLEAIPGGRTAEDWALLIGTAKGLAVPSKVQLTLEDLYPATRGSLPAHALRCALLDLSEAVPAFWTDLDRLRKAVDELIPAYFEARRAMEDGIPYVVGPLILDLHRSFEALPPEDEPSGAERAAVVALLERSLLDLSAAAKRGSGTGR